MFIFKFYLQLCHQFQFHLIGSYKVHGFQTANPWIRWLVLMDKYEFVHVVSLETTLLKCSQNASNRKDTFCFNMVGRDVKNIPCYKCNSWEFILLFVPPRQCTFSIFYINKISTVAMKPNPCNYLHSLLW